MAEMRLHANRILRPRILSSGHRRGLSGYFAFTHGSRPTWWRDNLVTFGGEILGIFENRPSTPQDALVITSEELVVLSEHRPVHVRYDAIESIEHLTKAPISKAIIVHLLSGDTISIPAYAPLGVAFSLVQFLICAAREAALRRQPSG